MTHQYPGEPPKWLVEQRKWDAIRAARWGARRAAWRRARVALARFVKRAVGAR
jgi:hypothetical protein